jgi:hypothetical protein
MRRGQATVELVLGVLVLTTVLIFGIHFAELGFLSLKVEESANFALWDATNHQMHDVNAGSWNGYTVAVGAAAAEAQTRYARFDGRSASTNSATLLTQVFTQVLPVNNQLIQVKCAPTTNVPGLSPKGSGAAALTIDVAVTPPNNGNTGMACSASAQMSGFHIPNQFFENTNGGWFMVPHYRPLVIHVCAAGLAVAGNCANNQYSLLLDDWALSGPKESEQCYLLDENACANPGYYKEVKTIYDAHPPGHAGAALAGLVAANPGVDEAKFWMSFAGSDSKWGLFTDHQSVEHRGYRNWETTPFSHPAVFSASWNGRTGCFMGMTDTPLTPCH